MVSTIVVGTNPSRTQPEYLQPLTVFASAARTATESSDDFFNGGYKGLYVVIDATVDDGTASVVFKLEGKDVASGKYYTILESAAIASVSTTVLKVFPGATAVGNSDANSAVPGVWRVTATHADVESLTYSVGAAPVL